MNPPPITAVIPAYQRERTVARAIESALAQEPPPAEVIVVDDGSTDGTRAAVQAFGNRVRYLHQTNAGAPAARNAGFRAARTEWVALLDSDDYWLPGHLARISAAIEGTGGQAVLYFADTLRPAEEEGLSQWRRARFAIEGPCVLAPDATSWVVRPRIPMMLQASVFHRERFLADGGLWDALRMRDDTHVFLKLGLGHPLCAVTGAGTQMTADDDSGNRLTTAVGSRTRRYWVYSTWMWRDLLERFPALDPDARLVLRRRLAVSHVRAARFALRDREIHDALEHAWNALRTDPRCVVYGALERARLRAPEADWRRTG